MWPRLSTSWSSDLESKSNGSLRLEERSRDGRLHTPMTNGENGLRSSDVIYNSESYLNAPLRVTAERRRGDLTKSSPQRHEQASFLSPKVFLPIMITAALTGLLLMLGSQFTFSVSRFSKQFVKGVALASDGNDVRTFSKDVSKCPGMLGSRVVSADMLNVFRVHSDGLE